MTPRQIILVTTDLMTSRAVSTALETGGHLEVQQVYRDLRQLTLAQEQMSSQPSAILVDIDESTSTWLTTLEPLVRRYTTARFVLLTSDLTPQLLLEALQIGARHCLLKSAIATELLPALKRILPAPTNDDLQAGHLITVVSAGGGCGSTTLTANLANELQLASAQPTLMIDLDNTYATLPTCLNLHGRYGLRDLLSRTDPVDSDLLATTVMTYSPHLHMLAATATDYRSETVFQPPITNSPRLGQILSAARQTYRYTLLDAPRLSLDLLTDLAGMSSLVLVVLQLSVTDIRLAKILLSTLASHGIDEQICIPVINRYRKRTQAIEPDKVKQVLGRDTLELLPNDFIAASHAINVGQPLSEAAPRSVLRHAVQDLSQQLIQKLEAQQPLALVG